MFFGSKSRFSFDTKKTGKADFGAKEVFELFFSWKKALAGVLKFHFVSLEAKRSN